LINAAPKKVRKIIYTTLHFTPEHFVRDSSVSAIVQLLPM